MPARLAQASYALSAAGASGFSLLVLSYALPTNLDLIAPSKTFVVAITNGASLAPLHLELRTTWTDGNGVSQTTPCLVGRVSNPGTFGGSAPQAQTLTLLLSGQNMMLPFTLLGGSALQCWVLAASTVADAAGCSGQVTLWGS